VEGILSAAALEESSCGEQASAWVLQWVCALVPVGGFEAVKRSRLREGCVACCRWSLHWVEDVSHLAVSYVVQGEECFGEVGDEQARKAWVAVMEAASSYCWEESC